MNGAKIIRGLMETAKLVRTLPVADCDCAYCTLMRGEQWTPEQLAEFVRPDGIIEVCEPFGFGIEEAMLRVAAWRERSGDRAMTRTGMPGRIVDDVRPDQRGDS